MIQPNYIFGIAHYLLQVIASLTCSDLGKSLSFGGIFVSLFFFYAMYDIGAICIACVFAHVVNFGLFYIDFFGKSKIKKE